MRELAASCTDGAYGPEIRRLGRTLRRWAEPIAAWHASKATNGPVEAIIIGSLDWGVVDVADVAA